MKTEKKLKSKFKIFLLFCCFICATVVYFFCNHVNAQAYFNSEKAHVTKNVDYNDVFASYDSDLEAAYQPFSADVPMHDITLYHYPYSSEYDGKPIQVLNFQNYLDVFSFASFYDEDSSNEHKFDHFAVVNAGDESEPSDFCAAIDVYFRFYSSNRTWNDARIFYNNFYACYADKVTCFSSDTSLGTLDKTSGWIYEYESGIFKEGVKSKITSSPEYINAHYNLSYNKNADGTYSLIINNNDTMWTEDEKPVYKTFTLICKPNVPNIKVGYFSYYVNGDYIGDVDAEHPSADCNSQGPIEIDVIWSENKIHPEITPPKTKSGLSYIESTSQSLCTAGSTSSGTMQYAIGSNDSTAPTTGWSSTIPTKINAGDYYIWYRVPEDDSTYPVDPSCIGKTAIGKASITVQDPTIYRGLIYNTRAQPLCNSTSSSWGAVLYALSNSETTQPLSGWSSSVPTGINAQKYYIWVKVDGDYNHSDFPAKFVNTATIEKADITVTKPSSTGILDYNFADQNLCTQGITSHGQVSYALGASDSASPSSGWTSSIPTAKNAGDYYVWIKVDGDSNYNDYLPNFACMTTINKLVPTVVASKAKTGLVYNTNLQDIFEPGSSNAGTLQYAISDNGSIEPIDGWTSNHISVKEAGTYYIWSRVVGDGSNIADVEAQCETSATIQKATPKVVAPVSKGSLIFNLGDQILCEAGSTNYGTLEYAIASSESDLPKTDWSADIPKACEVGEYFIWYKVEGDKNIDSFEPTYGCKTVIFAKDEPIVPDTPVEETVNPPHTIYSLPSTSDFILVVLFVVLLLLPFVAKPLILYIKRKSQQPSL